MEQNIRMKFLGFRFEKRTLETTEEEMQEGRRIKFHPEKKDNNRFRLKARQPSSNPLNLKISQALYMNVRRKHPSKSCNLHVYTRNAFQSNQNVPFPCDLCLRWNFNLFTFRDETDLSSRSMNFIFIFDM